MCTSVSEVTIQGIRVCNADRVVYPLVGFTKRHVIDYYVRIAPYILPHLKDRPVTLKRYPDEAHGQFFYEKDAPAFTPDWVTRFPVWRRSGESQIHYVVIDSIRALVWAASVGTLEIHPFLARRDIERPTEVVFDLDPGESANVLTSARVALLLREVLARLDLHSFAKVSGSKGIQVYVPLNGADTYAATRPFARTVAELLAREHPGLIVAEMAKELRKGRVFVDWSQNADFKTTVGVYSLRAKRRHPYISLPVDWDELALALKTQEPRALDFLPDAALERVKERGDLFAPVARLKQKIPETFTRQLHLQRTRAAPRPKRAETGPRASAQGSRRRFAVLHRESDPAYQVLFEIGEVLTTFVLPEGFPFRARETCPAAPAHVEKSVFERAMRAGCGKPVWDVGTCELVEGNAQKGYLLMFFNGETVRGEWTLFRSAPDAWHISNGAREWSESAPGAPLVAGVARSGWT
ncbi:MAG: non-homologous end-joining DNA ligase, partial [Acidobacteria bacterium]|nr:non-homologous end-joining DNA ligase [Acidobacteriota bacterium]